MGWGRTLLLGDIGNRLDIDDVEREIADLRRQLADSAGGGSQEQLIRKLLSDNAELKLYLTALIRLLVKNGIVTQSDLQNIVATVDAQDGRADGKYSGNIL